MKLLSILLLSFSLMFGLLTLGASADAVNDTCPFSGADVDAAQTVEIEKAVSFCCGNCLSKFEADPASFSKKVLATESQLVNDKCPISGKGTGKTVLVAGQSVGVCCGKCAKKVYGDPEFKVDAVNPATADCPISGRPANAEKSAVATLTVAFCCGKCVAKAKRNPAAVLSKL